ncbi:MAG TPA: lysylphosphatidylglycerol synthase domain-containing protein, partial [Polyangiaceae bacterium]
MSSARQGIRPGRLLAWALAIAALAFVAWVVPVRDRCWDPRAPESTKTSVSRQSDGCTLHVHTGDVHISSADCAALRCEPGVASTLTHARPGVLAALLALYAFGLLLWAARWRMLLAFAGVDMTVLQVWRVSTEAQAGGILLPGGIGGDALR